MQFDANEDAAISALYERGLDYVEAAVAVVMTTRGHVRTREQLIDVVLTGYAGLEDVAVTNNAIDQLLARGWLEETETRGVVRCRAVAAIVGKIQDFTGDEQVGRLLQPKGAEFGMVRILGAIGEPEIERSFRLAVGGAQEEIRMPMLGTPANLEFISDLEKRVRQGVHLKVLLASPQVMRTIRGAAQEGRATSSIDGWNKLANAWPNIEVRVTHRVDDMLLAASSGFDRSRVLFAVYDYLEQRSQQSTVIQVHHHDLVPNLVRLFNDHFDSAWQRSQPPGVAGRVRWELNQRRWELAFVASAGMVALAPSTTIQNLAGGIAVTSLIPAAEGVRGSIMRLLARLRQSRGNR
jgi:hypothetical protein